jgi:hypothetical protein
LSSLQSPRALELPFRWAGREGSVRVEVRENDDPAALGCPDIARGFPCSEYVIDPLMPISPKPHPFDFYEETFLEWTFAAGFHQHPLRP